MAEDFKDFVKKRSGGAVTRGELKKLKGEFVRSKTGGIATKGEVRGLLGKKKKRRFQLKALKSFVSRIKKSYSK